MFLGNAQPCALLEAAPAEGIARAVVTSSSWHATPQTTGAITIAISHLVLTVMSVILHVEPVGARAAQTSAAHCIGFRDSERAV